MATQNLGVTQTYKAGEDMSDKQFYLVYLSAADTVSLCTENGKAIGILQNEPESGEEAVVAVSGISKFHAAETVAIGKYVTSTSAGKGEVVDAAGEHAVGMCVEAADADEIGALSISLFTAYADDS